MVHTGCVARIGAKIVTGRCFNAKKPHAHELSTRIALRKINRCVCASTSGT